MHKTLLNHLKKCAKHGLLTYRQFIQEVLFAPKLGYYMQDYERVGRNPSNDFYTAESLGPVFRDLVLAAVGKILEPQSPKDYTFVEIGAEPQNGLLKDFNHPFKDYQTINAGQEIKIPSKSIVFANELLDAQAFHRLTYRNNQWHELGVRIDNPNNLSEELLPNLSAQVQVVLQDLPKNTIEGYHLDLPLGAEELLKKIVAADWHGLLILFDYGLLWDNLILNYPQGTARAYYKHKQHNDLLANIGKQDITCHICWDRLIPILKEHGFQNPNLQRQESFFIHHAQFAIEKIITEDTKSKINYNKQTLNELIHPSHMGHKFQVMWGMR